MNNDVRDDSPGGGHARENVGDVLADFVGGLEAEEAEVAQQVVVRRQELQVQLGQRQARLACVDHDQLHYWTADPERTHGSLQMQVPHMKSPSQNRRSVPVVYTLNPQINPKIYIYKPSSAQRPARQCMDSLEGNWELTALDIPLHVPVQSLYEP